MFGVKCLANVFSKCHIGKTGLQCQKKFSTLQTKVPCSNNLQSLCHNVFSKTQPYQSLLKGNQSSPSHNFETVRTKVRYNYFPRAEKRLNKHGLEKRLSKRSQREILFRRIIRGRHCLSTFDRFTNQLPSRPHKKTKKINLFDRKEGYKPKKPELYYL